MRHLPLCSPYRVSIVGANCQEKRNDISGSYLNIYTECASFGLPATIFLLNFVPQRQPAMTKPLQHIHLPDADIRRQIRHRQICWAGNKRLKIFGLLSCSRGKKMLRKNRVFFASASDAWQNNYRPCGHCMPIEYKKWKNELI